MHVIFVRLACLVIIVHLTLEDFTLISISSFYILLCCISAYVLRSRHKKGVAAESFEMPRNANTKRRRLTSSSSSDYQSCHFEIQQSSKSLTKKEKILASLARKGGKTCIKLAFSHQNFQKLAFRQNNMRN